MYNGLFSSKRYLTMMGFVLLAVLCFSSQMLAQAAPCSGIGASADDAILQLTLKDSHSTFHQGEIITLQLAFTSKSKGKYRMDTQTSGAIGRVTRESFCLDPAGAGSDPLADYYGSSAFSVAPANAAGHTVLKKNAFRLDLDLNEWKSLPPGNYRLVVETQRVSQVTATGELVSVIVRSNPVQFQVVDADSAWQDEQLAAAVKALDSGNTEQGRHAARVLRFLGTEAATHELATRYWSLNRQANGWDIMFGLVGSTHRDMAIQEMHNAISDPQHPITRDFLRTLALFEAVAADPQFKSASNGAQTQEQFAQALQDEATAIDKLVNQHLAELSSTVTLKTGSALKVSMETLGQRQSATGAQ
ncbi:MAG: hypothetical protein DMG65_08000 [Candidatus Angelobacter sp. Gp1-AA117]|nr:MAG: hypothetical protein DMG65_08000 [Candidatus Angelobacter sp. Gp1-AA117]